MPRRKRAKENQVKRPLLVAEDISTRRNLFRVFGVSWSATPYAWVSPMSWAALGLVMALASQRDTDGAGVFLAGLGYAAVLYAANILHSVGHIIAGRVVGAPAEIVLLTSTRDVIIYRQAGANAPSRRRLGRALGGPAANLAVGCTFLLAAHVTEVSWFVIAGLVNVGIAVWTLMPVPSLDGWVIWSTLTHSSSGGAA
jgi:hypothetical protein